MPRKQDYNEKAENRPVLEFAGHGGPGIAASAQERHTGDSEASQGHLETDPLFVPRKYPKKHKFLADKALCPHCGKLLATKAKYSYSPPFVPGPSWCYEHGFADGSKQQEENAMKDGKKKTKVMSLVSPVECIPWCAHAGENGCYVGRHGYPTMGNACRAFLEKPWADEDSIDERKS